MKPIAMLTLLLAAAVLLAGCFSGEAPDAEKTLPESVMPAQQTEPSPSLPEEPPEITVPAAELWDAIAGMEISGEYPGDAYRVQVTGLSVPLTLVMRDIHVVEIRAHGHTVVPDTPLRTVGPYDFDLFEAEGALIVERAEYGLRDVYVITPEKVTAFHPDVDMPLYLYEEDGALVYERVHGRFAEMEQFGALSIACGREDVFSESGSVRIEAGEVLLSEPETVVTVGERYDLDAEFAQMFAERYDSIDDVFRANREKISRRIDANPLEKTAEM